MVVKDYIKFPSPYGEMLFHTKGVIIMNEFAGAVKFPSPYGEMLFHTRKRKRC